uniref:Uncharacterized protein n=1 Tax=Glossina palpalis gambiensis TaxID=67801 RepID=A0A1B0B140_9MUSC
MALPSIRGAGSLKEERPRCRGREELAAGYDKEAVCQHLVLESLSTTLLCTVARFPLKQIVDGETNKTTKPNSHENLPRFQALKTIEKHCTGEWKLIKLCDDDDDDDDDHDDCNYYDYDVVLMEKDEEQKMPNFMFINM